MLCHAGSVSRHALTLPPGVYATRRKGRTADLLFLMNFTSEEKPVALDMADYTQLPTTEHAREISAFRPLVACCSILERMHRQPEFRMFRMLIRSVKR